MDFKILVIATNGAGRPTLKTITFESRSEAEAAFKNLKEADHEQTHTRVLPVRLYIP